MSLKDSMIGDIERAITERLDRYVADVRKEYKNKALHALADRVNALAEETEKARRDAESSATNAAQLDPSDPRREGAYSAAHSNRMKHHAAQAQLGEARRILELIRATWGES